MRTPQVTVESLFDSYASNLSAYCPQFKGIFRCPLCLRDFSKDSILSKEITLEHVIPSSIGGRLTTLTCCKCNSESGCRLEAHLVQRLRTEDIFAGKRQSSLTTRVTTGKGEFGAEMRIFGEQNRTILIRAIESISSPRLHELAVEELESGLNEFSIHGNLGYKETPSRVAALRMAYLMMFRYFGYGYILYPTLARVRAQVFQPEVETNALAGMFWLEDLPAANVVAILNQPEQLRCFLAVIDLSTAIKRNLAVVLPGLDPESETIYERWAIAAKSSSSKLKPRVDLIHFAPAFVSDSKYKFLPTMMWRKQVTVEG